MRSKTRTVAILLTAAMLMSGLGAGIGTETAFADTGGYPYASMACELSPYNTVGYCNKASGPYDWGPTENGSAASQISPYGYGYRNCTDYVAWKLASLGVQPAQYKGLGNGNSWGTRAAAHGVVNNTTPAVGSVAVSTSGSDGHVAFVTNVTGSQITVSQYNQAEDGTYSTQTGTAASLGFSSFDHFEKYETSGPDQSGLIYQTPGSTTMYFLTNNGSGPALSTYAAGMSQPAWEVGV
jgi:surface antigen